MAHHLLTLMCDNVRGVLGWPHQVKALLSSVNGQVEATNKTSLHNLIQVINEEPKRWADFIPLILWAYSTSKHTSIRRRLSPVCEAIVRVLIRVMVSSARLVLTRKVSDSHNYIYVEALDENRQNIEDKWLSCKRQISKTYNKRVRPWPLNVGYLVLEAPGHVKKGLNASKFAPKWEVLYIIREPHDGGYYWSLDLINSEGYLAPINAKWLKLYLDIFCVKVLDVWRILDSIV